MEYDGNDGVAGRGDSIDRAKAEEVDDDHGERHGTIETHGPEQGARDGVSSFLGLLG